MNELLKKIRLKDASAFTHSGKFHADDVFSSALLLYLNPEITILRGNKVPEDFDGIIFDIGRGRYDHHQKDSRIRENGIPKSWGKSLLLSLTKLLSSHWIIMIIPVKKMNWLH